MPPYSKWRTFFAAVKARETRITKALDRLFDNPAEYQGTDLQAKLTVANFKFSLPGWARQEMHLQGLPLEEIEHLDDWPPDQRDIGRRTLLDAITSGTPIKFFWEPHHGDNDEMTIHDPGQHPDYPGHYVITFRSPWSKVRMGGDSVSVGVGNWPGPDLPPAAQTKG